MLTASVRAAASPSPAGNWYLSNTDVPVYIMHSFTDVSVTFSLTVTEKAFEPGCFVLIITTSSSSVFLSFTDASEPPSPRRTATTVFAPPLNTSFIASVVPPVPYVLS